MHVPLVLTLLSLHSVSLVNAALFISEPFQGSAGVPCRGGKTCTFTWVDDGAHPLLSTIGVSYVGLFTGVQQLVQTITPVDVSTVDSVTFTPLSTAGPDSADYYIAMTPTHSFGNGSTPYVGFSPFFSLTGMSGSFKCPIPAATASIPIPKSIEILSTSSVTRTVTVGTLSTSLPHITSSFLPAPTTSAILSKFAQPSSSIIPSSTSTYSSNSTATSLPATSKSKSNGNASHLPGPLSVLFLAIFSCAFFS